MNKENTVDTLLIIQCYVFELSKPYNYHFMSSIYYY